MLKTLITTEEKRKIFTRLKYELDNGRKPPKKRQYKVFAKPTVEEIRAYCVERKNSIDANKFFNHYTSNGWKIGGRRL